MCWEHGKNHGIERQRRCLCRRLAQKGLMPTACFLVMIPGWWRLVMTVPSGGCLLVRGPLIAGQYGANGNALNVRHQDRRNQQYDNLTQRYSPFQI